MINNMANNDRTKWDYYFDMNVLGFLNAVSFYKDKQDNDNELLKKSRRGY